MRHPIHQMPIPHDSRSNYLLNFSTLTNYFIVPYGALILAFPFIIWRGASVGRLRPLLFGFWVTFILALGGTTPLPKLLLGRAFDILTFERFTLWAAVLALPLVGLSRCGNFGPFPECRRCGTCAGGSFKFWPGTHLADHKSLSSDTKLLMFSQSSISSTVTVTTITATLPWVLAANCAKVSTYTNASSVDGDYNSARLLPEMTQYGSAQLTNSKFYAAAGHGVSACHAAAQQSVRIEIYLRTRHFL